jgi:4-amino-4-deoxy-L-arabinose transferase-like glycosyltransferase
VSTLARLISRRLIFLLAVLAFPLLLQGSRGLLEPDEGRYAEVSREMLAHGDWLVPRLAGEPHLTKPPLTYWLTAAGIAALGRNGWGARVLLALVTSLTALLTGLVARRFCGRAAFRPAVVIQLLAFGPFVGGSILTTDAFLVLFETLAVVGFVEAWAGGAHPGRWAAVMGLGFGAAFLTKGPPGLLPLLAIGVFVLWRGPRWAAARRRLWSPWGLLGGLVVGLAWYAVMIMRTPGLAHWFIHSEVIARVVTAQHQRDNPPVIYLASLLGGFLPWTIALPFLAGGWRRTAVRVVRRLRRPADDRVRFLLLWFLLPLAVFVLARSRLPLYVLPLFVPLTVAAAGMVFGLADEEEAGIWAGEGEPRRLGASSGLLAAPGGFKRLALAWAAGLLLLKAAAAWWIPWSQDMRYLDRRLRQLAPSAEVVSVGREPLNGLRFYRAGHLAAWGDGPEDRMDLQGGDQPGDPPRLLVAPAGASWVQERMGPPGPAPIAEVRGRRLYLLPGTAPQGAASAWVAAGGGRP